jgi:hypothetical protein
VELLEEIDGTGGIVLPVADLDCFADEIAEGEQVSLLKWANDQIVVPV